MRERSKLDLIIAGFCILAALVTMGLNWQSPIAMALQRGERINGLLIGSDYEDNTRHSDTLMWVSYDPHGRFLNVLSIPRDTMVKIPDLPNVKRINEVFAYEFRHSGRDFNIASLALKNVVETMLSSGTEHPVDIPNYFTIDYGGFRSMIDMMGGVFVRVVEPMNYDDNWGHLHIHFQPGTYNLNGAQALEYVRFRGGSADQGRVRRQQLFIKTVIERMKNPTMIWRLPEYYKVFMGGFHTNVTLWDMISMVFEGRRLNWRNLRLMALPGIPQGMLWKVNMESAGRAIAIMQGAPAHPLPGDRVPANDAAGWRGRSTVEVWNASDHANAARAVMQLLRRKGFDVVRFGNFSTRQRQTIVLDRSGDLRPAQSVADALSTVSPDVISRPDSSLHVDVSVVVGNDYATAGNPAP